MEYMNVFNGCLVTVIIVLLSCMTAVNSQEGSGTFMCDADNACPENEQCWRLDADSEAECVEDPCLTGTPCSGSTELCVSQNNCGQYGLCTQLAYRTHFCTCTDTTCGDDQLCYRSDESADAECVTDPCTVDSTCTGSETCASLSNCQQLGVCDSLGNAQSICIGDPCPNACSLGLCISESNCADYGDTCDLLTGDVTYLCYPDACEDFSDKCDADETCSVENNAITCNTGTTGVCEGVNCHRGTCTADTDENEVVTAQCECDEGTVTYNATYCITEEEAEQGEDENPGPFGRRRRLYRRRGRCRIINHPWDNDYRNPLSELYRELKRRVDRECLRVYGGARGRRQGFVGCRLTGLSPGSIILEWEVIYNTPDVTDTDVYDMLIADLTNRTNINTGEGERWWGHALQLEESSIVFQTVSGESETQESSVLLPAVLGSSMAVVVICLAVVLFYYFGRAWARRWYAATYDDSEDTETSYQTQATPRYFYTRNYPWYYGISGTPQYTAPSQSSSPQWSGRSRNRGFRWQPSRGASSAVYHAR